MDSESQGRASSQVKNELQAQRELIMENHDLLRSIRRSMRINTILNTLRFLLILLPLLWAIIYLPSLIREYTGVLGGITATGGEEGRLPQGFDFSAIQGLLER